MIISDLLEEQAHLKQLMASAKDDICKAPEGSLRVTHVNGKPRFRHRQSKSDRSGTYIPKDQIHIAQALAQKGYAEKIIKAITPRMELLDFAHMA